MNKTEIDGRESREITFLASGALRSKQMMIIIDAINLVVYINSKWNAIKALVANTATEAARMIRFSHGMQNLEEEKLFMTV